MGSSSSKIASKAAGAASRRQYPSSPSIMNSAKSTANAPSEATANSTTTTSVPASSQVHPDPNISPPSDTKSEHIDLDGRDPQFGSRLSRLGAARPVAEARPQDSSFPTSSQPPVGQHGQNVFPPSPSQSSAGAIATNPAIQVTQARDSIYNRWQQESEGVGRSSFQGRTLVSATDIKEALRQRDDMGRTSSEVEKQMALKPGILDQLVKRGIVANP